MVLEVAVLRVKPGREHAFEAAMQEAVLIISAMKGFRGIEVRPKLDVPGHYLLTVRWRRREDHTEGFRKSPAYQQWRALLHDFYDPMPSVEYFGDSIV